MNHSLTVERLYFLGNFKNVKFTDTVTDIPGNLFTDADFQSALKFLSLVRMDKTFLKYEEHWAVVELMSIKDAEEYISELETQFVSTLNDRLIENKQPKQEKISEE